MNHYKRFSMFKQAPSSFKLKAIAFLIDDNIYKIHPQIDFFSIYFFAQLIHTYTCIYPHTYVHTHLRTHCHIDHTCISYVNASWHG